MQPNPMQDYVTFFGFTSRPFQTGPQRELVSSVGPLGEHVETLQQALQDGTAISVVTGPAGSGKTTLCEQIAHADAVPLRAVMLGTGRFDDPRAILQTILYSLDVPYEGLDAQELRLRLLKTARELRSDCDGLLLIVDEAELLPTEVLEELRSLTAHSEEGRADIRLLLCGGIEFDERLAAPELQTLRQRIGCQLTTEALTIEESARFLAGQLEAAGAAALDAIFHEDAVELICRASDGNLTGLCTLADHSLKNAATIGEQPVSLETVVETLHGLRHLPVHWQIPAQYEPGDDVSDAADNVADAAGTASEPEETPATEMLVEVPEWNGSDDDVAILEFGQDVATPDGPAEGGHEEPAGQPPVESVPTREVVEFAVDDPYAALDQQHGACSRVVPTGPVIHALPVPQDDLPQEGRVEDGTSVPGMTSVGADPVETAPGTGPDESGYDESRHQCGDEQGDGCESECESECDVEAETRIRGELEMLSRQIHQALRNTGRLRGRSALPPADWPFDDVEYDVIQPEDSAWNADDQQAERSEPSPPVEAELPAGTTCEPCEPASEADAPEAAATEDAPLAEPEPTEVRADAAADAVWDADRDADRDAECSADSDAAAPIRLPESESRREVTHYVDEAEEPRSRYALLFSRLKRRRADVARRLTDH